MGFVGDPCNFALVAWAVRQPAALPRSELCATRLAPEKASSSMLHVITVAAPAIYMHIFRHPIFATKTSGFVYLYAHFGNTDEGQAGFEEWDECRAHSRDERAVSYHRFFWWPFLRNIHGNVARGRWATDSFHKLTLRCLAEATAVVAYVFFAESDGTVLQTVPRRA